MSLEGLRSVGVTYGSPPYFFGFQDVSSGRFLSLTQVERRLAKQQARYLRTLIEQGILRPQPAQEIRIVLSEFWRYSYGFKFVEHGEYAGAIIEAWSFDRDLIEQSMVWLQSVLRKAVADHLGWSEEDWWFAVVDDGEGFQQVPVDRDLTDTFEWRIEEDSGAAVESGEGEL